MRTHAAVALCLGCVAALLPRATPKAARSLVKQHFLSPAISGFFAKTANPSNYEAIIQETMRREKCEYAEAKDRYDLYLFDPNGYALIKMKEQLMDEGYTSYEESFVAKQGQQAWDDKEAALEEGKQSRRTNSIFIVSGLFAVYLVVGQFIDK
ncbi:hypothetical protein M885DRAFT_585899 [Pelagophyceae sp. CCMP2097]|nr:hypothetical protein M885DRAFT_585899 [Pelagophyceae sp. CCMP2097]